MLEWASQEVGGKIGVLCTFTFAFNLLLLLPYGHAGSYFDGFPRHTNV